MDNMVATPLLLQQNRKRHINQRRRTLLLVLAVALLVCILVTGSLMTEAATTTSFRGRNLAPSAAHLFGTDWMGRDMLARTLKGLSISILIGLLASTVSSVMGLILGIIAAIFGKRSDAMVNFLVDTAMGLPHLLLLLLICVAMGKGTTGIVVAVAVTHWPSLTRIIRGEILQLREENYIKIGEKLGHSKARIAIKHMVPHIFPQFLVGLVLTFSHAILHEASITFLGFGLPPEQPGIGVILSESMKYLTMGMWWLALFPGLALLLTVVLFDLIGDCLKKLLNPHSAQH